MILTRLTITNLGVFRGRHEFELRPVSEQGVVRPVVLFGGKNGAGKTTILEAIRLCLLWPRRARRTCAPGRLRCLHPPTHAPQSCTPHRDLYLQRRLVV